MAHEDTTKVLLEGLRPALPRADGNNNYKLLSAIARELDSTARDIEEIDLATTVQDAFAPDRTVESGESDIIYENETEYYDTLTVNGTLTVEGTVYATNVVTNGTTDGDGQVVVDNQFVLDRLAEIGKLVNAPPNEGETVAHYRARLITEFSTLSTEGTIEDVLNTVAEIFDISTDDIRYQEPAGGEEGTVEIALPAQALDEFELSDEEVAEVLNRFIAASYRVEGIRLGTFTYITPSDYNAGAFDSSKGYDGLDANDDPKDNGGTYAGTI
jgi:hypothetical protein